MCDNAADDFVLAIKLVPDLFITSNVIGKLYDVVFSNDDLVFGDLKSGFVAFFSNDKGLNIVTMDSINLEDNNFNNFDPETINYITLMGWSNRLNQGKSRKKRQMKNY